MDQLPLSPVAEANHRIANSLALLAGLVRMQARALGRSSRTYSNPEIRLLFDGVAARLATIGQLHRMLSAVPAEGAILLNTHLRGVCANLAAAFSSELQPIRIEHHGTDCLVPTQYVQPITLIVCEILTNAIKYAHPSSVPVHLTLGCECRAEDTLVLTLADDGVGLPEGFDEKRDGGIGFQIMRALAAEIGAMLDVRSDNLGVTFHLNVPHSVVANARTA
ncbi:MAG TPA: sensor histidine kinase [Rhizomicrobium sp.]|nr:sensor histidine kinase [Rhizomicrobium sp.]